MSTKVIYNPNKRYFLTDSRHFFLKASRLGYDNSQTNSINDSQIEGLKPTRFS